MSAGSTIGIDDDLSSGQSRIALRAADHEASGRIYVIFRFLIEKFFRKHRVNDIF